VGEAKLNPNAKRHYLKRGRYIFGSKRRAKRFEIRLTIGILKGRYLDFTGMDPKTQEYTGKSVTATVTYTLKMSSFYNLDILLCVLLFIEHFKEKGGNVLTMWLAAAGGVAYLFSG
jgi:hypothetical protein